MNGLDIATYALILFEIGLGLSVLITNSRRNVNQAFVLISFVTALWMSGLIICFHTQDSAEAKFLIQLCTVCGSFFPAGFTVLRVSILNPSQSLWESIRQSRYWIWAHFILAGLAFSPWYVRSVSIPNNASTFSIPEPNYGWVFYIWALYYISGIAAVLYFYGRDIRRTRNRIRTDLQFVFWGLLVSMLIGVAFEIAIPLLRADSKSVRLAPIYAVGLQTIIAYGIASEKMLGVGMLVRRGVAYSLLCFFLLALYVGTWFLLKVILSPFQMDSSFILNPLATLVLALAMAPSHNIMQKFVSQIIGNWHGLDPKTILTETDSALQSVTTTPEVLRKFSELVLRASGTDTLSIYLLNAGRLQADWSSARKPLPDIPISSPLITILQQDRQPLSTHTASHHLDNPYYQQACQEIIECEGIIAFGVHDSQALTGVVILGEKLSGRIYDEDQISVLQVMVNRLSVALKNAALYTEIQESKLYVETLIDRLLSGVLVINEKGTITVANREAHRILQSTATLLGQDIGTLPDSIRKGVLFSLESNSALQDQTATLHEDTDSPIPIRFRCGLFKASEKAPREALVILNDVTHMKKLEEQLRRSDRLSSLGTLSASVAHEIKNPLVAIKTFVQLMPESKDDSEFLDSFTDIVGSEVNRIDNIVNQLLSFAKSSNPKAAEVHVHSVIESTLKLLQHDLMRKQIRFTCNLNTESDLVWADKHKLEQVILNIILNAADAMSGGGRLTINSFIRECKRTPGVYANPHTSSPEQSHLVISFEDNGAGLDPRLLDKVFDPFFTTKKTGTGLGLSIAYGIITEHKGTIELKNRPEGGACVEVSLPLYMATTLTA